MEGREGMMACKMNQRISNQMMKVMLSRLTILQQSLIAYPSKKNESQIRKRDSEGCAELCQWPCLKNSVTFIE